MKYYIYYRNKTDNKICKIHPAPDKYTKRELEGKAENWKSEDRTAHIIGDPILSEIMQYLDETKQLQENWKSSIKKEFLEYIRDAKCELNELEEWVENIDNEKS